MRKLIAMFKGKPLETSVPRETPKVCNQSQAQILENAKHLEELYRW